MTATPARDSDSEMEEMPLRERMAKFDEELAEHRGLVERLAPGPPKVIAPLTVAEAFDLLDAAKAKDAAEAMKITASDLKKMKVVDGIVKEPVGGAHRSPDKAIKAAGKAIDKALQALLPLVFGAGSLPILTAHRFVA